MKQYLLVLQEDQLEHLCKLIPSVQVLEIQGMDIGGNPNVKILVTPVVPPVNPMTTGDAQPPVEMVTPPGDDASMATQENASNAVCETAQ